MSFAWVPLAAFLFLSSCRDDRVRSDHSGDSWDGDGDAISTQVEIDARNDHHGFDTLFIDQDPSAALGDPWEGSIQRSINLPDNPWRLAYYHEPTSDPIDTDDWSTLALTRRLESASRCWSAFLTGKGASGPRVTILDMSLQDGGTFPGHQTHQNGLDADVRYVRSDGREAPLDLQTDPDALDLVGTLELLACFTSGFPAIDFILVDQSLLDEFHDWTGGRIRAAAYHSDHFHVRIDPDAEEPADGQIDPEAEVSAEEQRPDPVHRPRKPPRRLSRAATKALTLQNAVVSIDAVPLTAPIGRRAIVGQAAPRAGVAAAARRAPTADTTELAISIERTGSRTAGVRPTSKSVVRKLDPTTGVSRALYTVEERSISNVAVAPSGKTVAFLERSEAREGSAVPTSELVVLDGGGRQVYRNQDVQRISWNGRTSEILQIVGEATEGGVGYRSGRVVIADPATGSARRLQTLRPPYLVEWAQFDSAIYVQTLTPVDGISVFRLNPRTQALEPTNHQGVHFSPQGTYYIHHADERDSRARVYERSNDQVVQVPDSLGVPLRWVYETGSFLLLARSVKRTVGETPSRIRLARTDRTYVVWDVSGQRVVDTLDELPQVFASPQTLPRARGPAGIELQRRP